MAERDLTNTENLDRVSRKRWSVAAAKAFVDSQPLEVLAAVEMRGFDEFLRVSRPIYHGHAFHHEDFKRIYELICRGAQARIKKMTPAGVVN